MTIKKLKEKLENPFVLMAQGFVVGMILFWATAPEESMARTSTESAAVASIES